MSLAKQQLQQQQQSHAIGCVRKEKIDLVSISPIFYEQLLPMFLHQKLQKVQTEM
jgi:hypothetical protein